MRRRIIGTASSTIRATTQRPTTNTLRAKRRNRVELLLPNTYGHLVYAAVTIGFKTQILTSKVKSEISHSRTLATDEGGRQHGARIFDRRRGSTGICR